MARIPSFNTPMFFFLVEISPTGDKNKPSATSRKEFLKKTSRTFTIFLKKKRRKKRKIFPDLNNEFV